MVPGGADVIKRRPCCAAISLPAPRPAADGRKRGSAADVPSPPIFEGLHMKWKPLGLMISVLNGVASPNERRAFR